MIIWILGIALALLLVALVAVFSIAIQMAHRMNEIKATLVNWRATRTEGAVIVGEVLAMLEPTGEQK